MPQTAPGAAVGDGRHPDSREKDTHHMFSRKKIAAVSGLIGGLAVASTGVAQAYAAGGPGTCTRDLAGNISCIQHIEGEIPASGIIPHQESCAPVQPLTLPSATGNGSTQLGPEVTCSPTTSGVPVTDGAQDSPDLLP
ncbi:hypothetical protein [Streptomyces sp. NPDC048521]|uniref:hypothetical protein n=1 Tax=Streptomyces sp. NPDC048521 TaxID=3365566 RepID=UPI00371FE86C